MVAACTRAYHHGPALAYNHVYELNDLGKGQWHLDPEYTISIPLIISQGIVN